MLRDIVESPVNNPVRAKHAMIRPLKWMGYVFFAVVVSGLFLYLCFPSDAVCQFLEKSASRAAPALSVDIGRVRPAFPFGFVAEQTALMHREQPGFPLFKAASFVLMPSVQNTFMLKRPAFRFDCRAYGGTVEGIVVFGSFGLKRPFQTNVKLDGLRLGLYAFLKEKLGRTCTGTMSGTLSYLSSSNKGGRGSGKGVFSVVNGSVRFAQPFFGAESLDFDRIDIELVLNDQTVSLEHFVLKGKQLEGTGSGTIQLNPVVERSALNLTLLIKPLSDLAGMNEGLVDTARFFLKRLGQDHVTVHVGGTIAQPRINFV